ncbi:MAG: zinc-dependent alcohol dehydrogenase family protein [Desulfuromonadales bacterium]|nr:zinc-dependent alcohol dehydrogenase family protein [Desulfuromonadales bacterium]
MRAMLLEKIGEPLSCQDVPIPEPGPGQVLIRVSACAVCRTDLHVIDRDLKEPKLPLILGHEIVGEIIELGQGAENLSRGQRVGVPWLGRTCNTCRFCTSGQENLCLAPGFTGYQIDGGFAEYTVADARYCFPLPDDYPDVQAAPLLCAGLIGYRSLRMTGSAQRLGLYGFGAAAHIIIQVAKYEQRDVYAFTRPGDTEGQAFAMRLGATWAGGSDQHPPTPLDAAIIFAPEGHLVPAALEAVDRGGIVVCAGIHMSDIPAFPYQLLWEERSIKSVANLTRQDGLEFLQLAPRVPVRTEVQLYELEEANRALEDLRNGKVQGAAVLKIS